MMLVRVQQPKYYYKSGVCVCVCVYTERPENNMRSLRAGVPGIFKIPSLLPGARIRILVVMVD